MPSGTTDGIPTNYKQNSDASGLFYQWGRKDPFTFATSSEKWGNSTWQQGKYPLKIYTIDGVLIYQESNGSDNKYKQPAGGVLFSWSLATSMMETNKNPVLFYSDPVINQTSQTKELWNYYWTSYSRGTDGASSNENSHNEYLNGYIFARYKSLYDPCPYGFRMPSNGVYNQFSASSGWIRWSYVGGIGFEKYDITSWFISGRRSWNIGQFSEVGDLLFYRTGTNFSEKTAYALMVGASGGTNKHLSEYGTSTAFSVRCIEELD